MTKDKLIIPEGTALPGQVYVPERYMEDQRKELHRWIGRLKRYCAEGGGDGQFNLLMQIIGASKDPVGTAKAFAERMESGEFLMPGAGDTPEEALARRRKNVGNVPNRAARRADDRKKKVFRGDVRGRGYGRGRS